MRTNYDQKEKDHHFFFFFKKAEVREPEDHLKIKLKKKNKTDRQRSMCEQADQVAQEQNSNRFD